MKKLSKTGADGFVDAIFKELGERRRTGREIHGELIRLVFGKKLTRDELKLAKRKQLVLPQVIIQWLDQMQSFELDFSGLSVGKGWGTRECTLQVIYQEDAVTICIRTTRAGMHSWEKEPERLQNFCPDDHEMDLLNSFLPQQLTFDKALFPSDGFLLRTEHLAINVYEKKGRMYRTFCFEEPESLAGQLAFKAQFGDDHSYQVLIDMLESKNRAVVADRIVRNSKVDSDRPQLIDFLRNQI